MVRASFLGACHVPFPRVPARPRVLRRRRAPLRGVSSSGHPSCHPPPPSLKTARKMQRNNVSSKQSKFKTAPTPNSKQCFEQFKTNNEIGELPLKIKISLERTALGKYNSNSYLMPLKSENRNNDSCAFYI